MILRGYATGADCQLWVGTEMEDPAWQHVLHHDEREGGDREREANLPPRLAAFFEHCYESGKAERWRSSMVNGKPFAVAGIWRAWQEIQGYTFSFCQLTIKGFGAQRNSKRR